MTPESPPSLPDDRHEVRSVLCMVCDHRWTAVCPVGTGALECPRCGQYAGVTEYVKLFHKEHPDAPHAHGGAVP